VRRGHRIALPGKPLVNGETALRPWRDDDLDELVALCQDPEIGRWTRVPSPYRQTDGRAYLLHRYDLLAAGVSAPFAVVAATRGELLGSVALMNIDRDHARAEVGYWLGAGARGQGHATRAVQAISRWGHRQLSLERLTLYAAAGNVASQAVAERAGFSREAVLRSYAARPDGRHDMMVFGLLAR
jgi:RimJ/RimL family protein N-acetyltransferase